MLKQTVAYQSMNSMQQQKQPTTNAHKNIDGSQENYDKFKKPVSDSDTLYGSTCMAYLKPDSYSDRKQICDCLELRLLWNNL